MASACVLQIGGRLSNGLEIHDWFQLFLLLIPTNNYISISFKPFKIEFFSFTSANIYSSTTNIYLYWQKYYSLFRR